MKPQDQNRHSRLEPDPVPRRDVLGLAALWSAAAAALFATFGMIRLPRSTVIASPPKGFRVSLPDALTTSGALVPANRNVGVFRDAEGVYAISLVCTHLGCIVTPEAEGFHCPCHGARFDRNGSVVEGPPPRPLRWVQVTVRDGELYVDDSVEVGAGTKVTP